MSNGYKNHRTHLHMQKRQSFPAVLATTAAAPTAAAGARAPSRLRAAAGAAALPSTHLTMTARHQQDEVWEIYGAFAANDQRMGFHMMDGVQREGVLFAESFRVLHADLKMKESLSDSRPLVRCQMCGTERGRRTKHPSVRSPTRRSPHSEGPDRISRNMQRPTYFQT